ncbi:MAG: hypothetical protein E7255_01980 [Lachnospiraceae bacterium]|nr:hypothetical protein [Lachnospiraceae bacterium]
MADYKRMVSYMYQYENGIKRKNVGYARIEARDGQCKVTLHMQMLGQPDSIFPTYLIHRDHSGTELIYLGDSRLRNQVLDGKLLADESNIMNSGYKLSDIGGIILFLNSGEFFATEWDDKPIEATEIMKAMKPKPKKETAKEAVAAPVKPLPSVSQSRELGEGEKKKTEVSEESTTAPNRRTVTVEEEERIPKYQLPRGWKTVERLPDNPYDPKRRTDLRGAGANTRTANQFMRIGYPVSGKEIGRTGGTSRESNRRGTWERSYNRNEGNNPTAGSRGLGRRETVRRETESPVDTRNESREMLAAPKEAPEIASDQNEFQESAAAKKENQGSIPAKKDSPELTTDRNESQEMVAAIREARESTTDRNESQEGIAVSNELQETMDVNQESRESTDIKSEVQETVAVKSDIQETAAVRRDIADRQVTDENKSEEAGSRAGNRPYTSMESPVAARIFQSFPRINPFEDNEVILSVKIEPKDIGLLPRELWGLSNNSFLLHGYYSYRHLIFAKMKDRFGTRYIIGVPGTYHNKEQFIARMFGFDCFKSAKRRELRQGDFGYWYIAVSV